MNAADALRLVKTRGILLESARGAVPSLIEELAGGPIRGSWWGHPKARDFYGVLSTVRDSPDVLTCKLIDGKVTLVHRRLWPAIVRLSGRLPKSGLAAIQERHTAGGKHEVTRVPFPRWVPSPVLEASRGMQEADAVRALGSSIEALPLSAASPRRGAR